MISGSGADTFLFDTVNDCPISQTADRIVDFERGIDIVDLSGLIAGEFVFAGKNPLTGGGTTSVAFSKSGSVLTVDADLDGDGTADFHLLVTGPLSLNAADFVL